MNNIDKQELNKLIKIINDNAKSVYQVGCALRKIKEKNFHLKLCKNFEMFCQTYLGISRAYAYRQIAASKTMDNLKPIGDNQINEAQLRPLTRLKPDTQKLAWNYAIDIAMAEGRKLTYHDVNNAVKIITQDKQARPESTNKIVNIDLASKDFKKAYDIFFKEIKKTLKSSSTEKKIIIKTLNALIKHVKSHDYEKKI